MAIKFDPDRFWDAPEGRDIRLKIKELDDQEVAKLAAKEIAAARKELEPLTNDQLILRALASLVSHALPHEIYYQIMASILRERSEEWY